MCQVRGGGDKRGSEGEEGGGGEQGKWRNPPHNIRGPESSFSCPMSTSGLMDP